MVLLQTIKPEDNGLERDLVEDHAGAVAFGFKPTDRKRKRGCSVRDDHRHRTGIGRGSLRLHDRGRTQHRHGAFMPVDLRQQRRLAGLKGLPYPGIENPDQGQKRHGQQQNTFARGAFIEPVAGRGEHHIPPGCRIICTRAFPSPVVAAPAETRRPAATRSASTLCNATRFGASSVIVTAWSPRL